nr:EOG090X0755 [Lepidurus arcticus]
MPFQEFVENRETAPANTAHLNFAKKRDAHRKRKLLQTQTGITALLSPTASDPKVEHELLQIQDDTTNIKQKLSARQGKSKQTQHFSSSPSALLSLYELERLNRVQATVQRRFALAEEQRLKSYVQAQTEFDERIRMTKLKPDTLQQNEQALEAYARQRKQEIETLHTKQTELFTLAFQKAAQAAESEKVKQAAELQLLRQHEVNCRALEILLQQIGALKEQVLDVFRSCSSQKSLVAVVTPQIQRLKEQEVTLAIIHKATEASETSSLAVSKAKEALENSQKILQEIRDAKELLDGQAREAQKAQELEKQSQELRKEEPKIEVHARTEPQEKPRAPVPVEPEVPPVNATEDNELAKYVHPMMYERYKFLENFLKDYEEACAPLEKNPSFKQFIFKCKKAAITPVNTIAEHSASHLKEIWDRLKHLLHGQSVTVDGRPFAANQHPQGIAYCMKTMARKFVSQGENAVSSKSSPYPIAAVLVALAAEFPIFGQLVEAYFYRCCPYLVPYYVPNEEGQSNEHYLKALGYIYEDNNLENETQYFTRMSGMVRLYTATCIAALPSARRHRGAQHPFCIAKLWIWFAMILNLEPRSGITALIINDVLVVGGHTLYQTYGSQFHKLLHALCTDYFIKIKEANPKGSGHVGVLQVFLEKTLKEGGIGAPSNLLSANFW